MIMGFFFKQKTAYDMRISDWSSDVCSSDLSRSQLQPEDIRHVSLIVAPEYLANCRGCRVRHNRPRACPELGRELVRQCHLYQPGKLRGSNRSEEHTSELQSLMRISYAVFCLKKKNNINQVTKT